MQMTGTADDPFGFGNKKNPQISHSGKLKVARDVGTVDTLLPKCSYTQKCA